MARFELNQGALADLANQAVAIRAQQMQVLLDGVLASHGGEDVSTVKFVLGARWQQQFDRALTDPHLSAWSEQLAKGGRIVVKPEILPA